MIDSVEAARQGLRYERRHFSAAHGNWPDFREQSRQPNGQPGFLTFWCHGAAGIGMSRLQCRKTLVDDPSLLQRDRSRDPYDEPTLLPDAIAGPGNYCLCHGAGGNSELMILAAEMLGRRELAEIADHVGLTGIEQIEQRGLPWPCGTHGGLETPNLMVGLAGIGHFYLRLYDAPVRTLDTGPRTAGWMNRFRADSVLLECHRLVRWIVTFLATAGQRRSYLGMPPACPVDRYVPCYSS